MNTPVPDPPAADPSPSQSDATGEQGHEETYVPGEADTGTEGLARMADADAESLSILNQAHRRDVEFYRFTRTLESYRRILNDRTTLVLSGSSELLKLLTRGVPVAPSASSPPPVATPATSASSQKDDR